MLFSIRGMWAAEHAGSVAVAPGPTSPTKNQTCISLHWKADSQPLEHRRNPFIFKLYLVSFLFFGHALQLEGSYFPDQAVEGQNLNHWTVREVPTDPFSMSDFQNHKIINVSFFFFLSHWVCGICYSSSWKEVPHFHSTYKRSSLCLSQSRGQVSAHGL